MSLICHLIIEIFYKLTKNEEKKPAYSSQILGYVIVTASFCLQPVMRIVCSHLKGLPRLIAADAFLLVSFIGTVNVWRGIWMALDHYFLPKDLKLSCWITHFGCFAFLVLLNCSNSVLVRGVYIDGSEEGGKCVVFPCHYLREFFKVREQTLVYCKRRQEKKMLSIYLNFFFFFLHKPREYTKFCVRSNDIA